MVFLLCFARGSTHDCAYQKRDAWATELLRFAHALRRDGRLEEATACYQWLTEIHPRFGDGWFELGLAEQALGHMTTATAAFEAGLRVQPSADGRLGSYATILQVLVRTSRARIVAQPPSLPWSASQPCVVVAAGLWAPE